jgi:hypothetical protein
MKASIHTHLTKAIVPAVLAAGLAVPAAVAGNSYPDAVGRAVNVHNTASYPDAFGRAVNAQSATGYPDAFERAAISSVAAQSSAAQVGQAVGTADTLRPARESGAQDAVGTLVTPDSLRPARESGAQDAVGTLVTPDSLRPARESGAQEVGGALVSPDTLRPVRESGSPEAATLAGMEVVKIVESGGFDWVDAGIGAGGGIAFLLVLAAGGSMLLRGKARPIKA